VRTGLESSLRRRRLRKWLSGRASPCQGEGRGFESRLPLQQKAYGIKENDHLSKVAVPVSRANVYQMCTEVRNHPPFRRRPDYRQRRLATWRQASRSLVKMAPMALQAGATGSRCAAQRPRPGGGSRSGAWAFPTCSHRSRSPQGEVSAASLGGPQTTNSIDLDSGYHGARWRPSPESPSRTRRSCNRRGLCCVGVSVRREPALVFLIGVSVALILAVVDGALRGCGTSG